MSVFISTRSLTDIPRLSMAKLQEKLAQAQKEVSTGRLADVGASLGLRTGETVSLRQEHGRLQSIKDTNGVVASRLEATQAALGTLSEGAKDFLNQLVAARNGEGGAQVIQQQAQAALAAFADTLNSTFNGVSLFAGVNTDVQPVTAYATQPPAANAQAVATAFQTAFGITQSDPGVANISAAAMQTFLDGPFAALFDPAGWSSTWSAASDQNIKSRISTSEMIETSVNANDAAFRKLASAYTMLADLGAAGMNQAAFQALVDEAIGALGAAEIGLTQLGADIGTAQERVAKANDRMSIQIDIITTHIGALENVDPYEASSRLSELLTQVQTAYAMTARIQGLSLLNYLPPN
jgi:flagellar hook-associated protein 3 FlgL